MRMTRMRTCDSDDKDIIDNNNNNNDKMMRTRDEDTRIKKMTRTMRDNDDEG